VSKHGKPLDPEYHAKYYRRNREKILERHRAYHARNQAAFDAYKVELGCERCGYSENAKALQLHHKSGRPRAACLKAGDFYYQSRHWQAERADCELLCANCHTIETYDG
jgi:hypothetical protein